MKMLGVEFENLGAFQVTSGRLRVTDPCYNTDVWCSGTLENVKNGTWGSDVTYSDEGEWGKRVSSLAIWYAYKNIADSPAPLEKTDIHVGVDSGQAGFFDESFYPNITELDEVFYEIACRLTSEPKHGGTMAFGVVSSTGYGDGGYNCYVGRDADGQIVSARIIFIGDPNDEDYFEDDEEDMV